MKPLGSEDKIGPELKKLADDLDHDLEKVNDAEARQHFKIACEIVKELARTFEELKPDAKAA